MRRPKWVRPKLSSSFVSFFSNFDNCHAFYDTLEKSDVFVWQIWLNIWYLKISDLIDELGHMIDCIWRVLTLALLKLVKNHALTTKHVTRRRAQYLSGIEMVIIPRSCLAYMSKLRLSTWPTVFPVIIQIVFVPCLLLSLKALIP